MESIIKGDALMLFLNGKSIAQATSHQLSTNTEMVDINTKDYGKFGSKSPQKVTWELTTDALYTNSGWKTLIDAQLAMTPITAYFGFAEDNEDLTGLGTASYFEPDFTQPFSYGEVYISSLNATAATGENATVSCSMSGTGQIHTVNPA